MAGLTVELGDLLPLRWGDHTLSTAPGGALRLITRDADGSILDIREQVVALPPPSPRRAAWLRAWRGAFPAIAEAAGSMPMPGDLIFPELLDDPRLCTEADFAAALAPERLAGRWRAREAAELRALLSAHLGPDDPHIPGLIDQALAPAVALEIGEDDPVLSLGESRLGGAPDLPDGLAWPALDGRPLTLLAQLDLSSLPPLPALPREGALLFFFDLGRGAGGQVLWTTAPLRRRSPPEAAPPLACRGVAPRLERGLLPHIETPFYGPHSDRAAGLGPWMQPPLGGAAPRPRDRLLGLADPLQSDPYLQCALAARGLPPSTPTDAALCADAAGWRLLLQADSDRDARVFLGDMGAVYFFIRPADLAARDFSGVCVVWQSC